MAAAAAAAHAAAAAAAAHAAHAGGAQFFAVYDASSTLVVAFFRACSEQLAGLYEAHAAAFQSDGDGGGWRRFASDGRRLSTQQAAAQQWQQPAAAPGAAGGAAREAAARKLLQAHLPACPQLLCPSPYLDARLFAYDERAVAPLLRARPQPDHPIKFVARCRPSRAAFKLSNEPRGEAAAAAAVAGRPLQRAATHLFHPSEPFALTVVQTLMQPTLLHIYYRAA